LHGHPAPRAHVRIRRPPDDDRAPAREGLPRPERQIVRRTRQLRDGDQGTHRVPGDQLRQRRPGLGHGHHCVHDGAHERGSESTPDGVWLSFPQLGALEDEMAKKSPIEKNNRRRKMAETYAKKRAELKATALDESLPLEERFEARMKL